MARVQVDAAAVTFEAMARAFHGLNNVQWSASNAYDWLRAMERDVFPEIGARHFQP